MPDKNKMIDTNFSIGHWPFRTLPGEDPAAVTKQLRQSGITQAWTGHLDGLFQRDVAAVNLRLAETCRHVEAGLLIPFGAVNPTLPDWEEDLRRCHETFHMPGIRLHPNYHGYTLDGPRFARLLELSAARGLVVQLVACLDDEPHFLLSPPKTQVDLKPLADKIGAHENLRLVVANGYRSKGDDSFRALAKAKQVHFDFAHANDGKDVLELRDAI